MASIGFLIGGALVNALVFTGSNYLFSSLSKESIDKEQKRHDKAIEDLQQAQIEWAKKTDLKLVSDSYSRFRIRSFVFGSRIRNWKI